jgi:hypothetical protein
MPGLFFAVWREPSALSLLPGIYLRRSHLDFLGGYTERDFEDDVKTLED